MEDRIRNSENGTEGADAEKRLKCEWCGETLPEDELLKEADIVHFNSGEWDICELFGDGPFTPEDFYVSQLKRIVKILQDMGKTVIFATTTPAGTRERVSTDSTSMPAMVSLIVLLFIYYLL